MNFLATKRGRQFLFFALYVSEGAPIGFLWWALPTWLRNAGLEVEAITGLTSMLVLPWMFKFLWSPLIDAARSRRWTLRSWILSAQLLMGASLAPLLLLDPATGFAWMVPVLLFHACAAATQDAAIDALAIASVPRSEQGSLNGWMQVGMLLGRSALGGGALLMEALIGPRGVVLVLIGVIWSSSLLIFFSRETTTGAVEDGSLRCRFTELAPKLRHAFRSRVTWLGLLFALVAGAGFEGVGAVAGPFLIDRGFSPPEVGHFFTLFAVPGMVAGALAGGWASDLIGKRRIVALSLLLLSATIFALSVYDQFWTLKEGSLALAILTLLYVCIGLFTASSYALFMGITEPGVGATQFSAFMAATNACESWSAIAVGRIIPALGYGAAFAGMAVVSLTVLPCVRLITVKDTSGRSHA
jgi:MFS family permease